MRKVDKPWGHELIWAETSKYAGKLLFIKDGFSLSLQYHSLKEETIMVKSGVLTFEVGTGVDRRVLKMGPNESHHIPPGLVHRMSAQDGDVEVLEVSTAELDDVVRLADKYGRT